MSIRVLVVDDSSFFRRRIIDILEKHPDVEIVDTAVNGQEALDKVLSKQPHVVTMDYEMPIMNGVSAVRAIMKQRPTPILMLSSLTQEGARVTLDALDAGAVDFMPKSFESVAKLDERSNNLLLDKVITLGNSRRQLRGTVNNRSVPAESSAHVNVPSRSKPSFQPKVSAQPRSSAPKVASVSIKAAVEFRPKVICIGSSTGGPVALQGLIKSLPGNFPYPVLVTQHMPATFTHAFAERLNGTCALRVKEAETGDKLVSGQVLIAPGGKQMTVAGSLHNPTVSIIESGDQLVYKPSVDVTFGSVARLFAGSALAIVLTGMGSDGTEGAKLLKARGSQVWAQDENSCIVYGMPRAVAQANLVDEVVTLGRFPQRLIDLI